MMNPFLMCGRDRLENWQNFRRSLKNIDRDEQLQAVVDYWAQAPISNFAYDAFELDKCPSPWEMIDYGYWCRDSVAIGMEFTLRLAGWSAEEMSLIYIKDYDISEQILILKIDTGEVLNYIVGEINDYPNTQHDLLCSWKYIGRGYQII